MRNEASMMTLCAVGLGLSFATQPASKAGRVPDAGLWLKLYIHLDNSSRCFVSFSADHWSLGEAEGEDVQARLRGALSTSNAGEVDASTCYDAAHMTPLCASLLQAGTTVHVQWLAEWHRLNVSATYAPYMISFVVPKRLFCGESADRTRFFERRQVLLTAVSKSSVRVPAVMASGRGAGQGGGHGGGACRAGGRDAPVQGRVDAKARFRMRRRASSLLKCVEDARLPRLPDCHLKRHG
eukprot:6193903-Pleurochrysis_carterae.AAC.4